MRCEHCGGSGAVPVVYVDKRRKHAGQLALAAQLCLLCGGKGERERRASRAMTEGRVTVGRKAVRS